MNNILGLDLGSISIGWASVKALQLWAILKTEILWLNQEKEQVTEVLED